METITIRNPVIPGFYSDPSVCRVGGDYYLVTSTFAFYPGVPLLHSRDLLNWEQLRWTLERPDQLPLGRCDVSDGVYAPTLRHHGGRFYMVSSNRTSGSGNHFYVTTEDAAQPWSDPVWITGPDGEPLDGLDPSLFFDEDGRVYFSCVAWDEHGQGVGQAEIDLPSGRLLAPLKIVWYGTGGTFPEGPHTYRVNGRYYLMIAEGGTEYGHRVTIARADRIDGPYHSCPHNPILTQNWQWAQASGIQGVGHGDLIQAEDGRWWLLVHGFRPSVGKLHHLGRETMLCPVVWNEEGWPVAGAGKGWLEEEMELAPPVPGARQLDDATESHTFGTAPEGAPGEAWMAGLPLPFQFINNPVRQQYRLLPNAGGLQLLGCTTTLDDIGSPTWCGLRQRHFDCCAEAVLSFAPSGAHDYAGLSVFQTCEHHYDIVVGMQNGRRAAWLRKRVGDILTLGEAVPLPEDGPLILSVQASREVYTFAVAAGQLSATLGSGRVQLISTEAMQYHNFTGTYFALFAECAYDPAAPATFEQMRYTPMTNSAP